jgi:hypothetical protein
VLSTAKTTVALTMRRLLPLNNQTDAVTAR